MAAKKTSAKKNVSQGTKLVGDTDQRGRASSRQSIDPTKTAPKRDQDARVLSMDGGSIYGTFTAIMLRKLCAKSTRFLTPRSVTLFSGTSAGALNALLLAKENNPRQAIENRTLEKFHADERVYSNRLNPITGTLSLLGLTAWSGKADFYSVLDDHFGEMRMRDLKHRVMITAFNLAGAPDPVSGQYQWRPKMFYNFPEREEDRALLVKDVAYGAASPPVVRPIVNGITDGGFFASDPSAFAIAKLLDDPPPEAEVRKKTGIVASGAVAKTQIARKANDIAKDILKRTSVLSMGVGAAVPTYFLPDFDFGVLPFHLLPTNAMNCFFGSPLLTFALNPAKNTTVYEASRLVGSTDYFRLDPPVIGPPLPSVINAAFLARFYICRQLILKGIYKLADSEAVDYEIDRAYQWMKDNKWT